jgi:uncharacterized protein (DUF1800 family)
VVHLHRRAGFAASWAEIERDLKEGPDASIDRVLAGRSRIGAGGDFEPTASLLADAAVASNDLNRLRASWIFRMLWSPDPLGERLTLLWHDHFATAQSKVEDLGLMRRQNDSFRRFARAPFGDLLNASLREPALLLYLDAPNNRKDHPNENLARELMELFTLGIGHFTEADVKDAARALTGWTVDDGAFLESASKHDDGEKTLLGHKGRFSARDLLSILIDLPATARRLASRLCSVFMGERAIDNAGIAALADILRGNKLDIGKTVATVLQSRAFFAEENIGTRVIGPVEFVIGACCALAPRPLLPSTLLLADWTSRLGQELFEPPNVGGWPGGRAWLTPRALVGRANFAASFVEGRPVGLPGPLDAAALACDQGLSTSADGVRAAASSLLLGVNPKLGRPVANGGTPDEARQALASILASPEAQLG